jgi:hypothetical protein
MSLILRKPIIAGAALALSLAFAGTAHADTVNTRFDGTWHNGITDTDVPFVAASVDGQDGWTATGPYDQAIVDVAGDKKLRISNAITAQSFGDMTFSKPVTKPAGEDEATNVLVNEFTIKAPDTLVPGLMLSVSPDDGNGGRMSYLRFEDTAAGVRVFFTDATFNAQEIAVLDRSVEHTVNFETTFVDGHSNDVVLVSIDGKLKMRGASWENYYRADEERNPSATDRLIIRTAGTAAPATLGSGFLFDNVMSKSSHVDNPAPLNPPAPGPAGKDGVDGKNGVSGINGVNGKDGVTTIIRQNGVIAGATMRTLRVKKISGMKFISAKATLSGKRIKTVKGRTIKVDLRGKSVGEYRVRITAKYQAGGKTYKVRSIRSLSIIRK